MPYKASTPRRTLEAKRALYRARKAAREDEEPLDLARLKIGYRLAQLAHSFLAYSRMASFLQADDEEAKVRCDEQGTFGVLQGPRPCGACVLPRCLAKCIRRCAFD